MDRKTGSTAGPTCASCTACTAEATISPAAHARALNRCVRRTVSHGISDAKARLAGHIASAKDVAREHISAAERRAASYWDRLKGAAGLRLYDASQGGPVPEALGRRAGALGAGGAAFGLLLLASLAGCTGARMLRRGRGAGAAQAALVEEEGGLLQWQSQGGVTG